MTLYFSLHDFCECRENETDKDYMAEIQSGPTIGLKPISYEISSKCEEISALVCELQEDITRIRSQFKERMVSFYLFNNTMNVDYITCANDSYVGRGWMSIWNARRIYCGRDSWRIQIHCEWNTTKRNRKRMSLTLETPRKVNRARESNTMYLSILYFSVSDKRRAIPSESFDFRVFVFLYLWSLK